MTDPAPKFRVGSAVLSEGRRGIVKAVHVYDALVGGYRYRVRQNDGSAIYWNEPTMRKEPDETDPIPPSTR